MPKKTVKVLLILRQNLKNIQILPFVVWMKLQTCMKKNLQLQTMLLLVQEMMYQQNICKLWLITTFIHNQLLDKMICLLQELMLEQVNQKINLEINQILVQIMQTILRQVLYLQNLESFMLKNEILQNKKIALVKIFLLKI